MGEVVNLEDFRKSNQFEEDYLKFLTHVNKFCKIPTTIPDVTRIFYYTLRYLEGTVNCLEILTILKQVPDNEVYQLKQLVSKYLNGINDDLNKI